MARITMPTTGLIGITDSAENKLTTVQFNYSRFHAALEHHGYRLLWERASLCPCKPISKESRQPSPNCTRCGGSGFYYYGPIGYQPDPAKVGKLDDLQTYMQQQSGGAIIKGLMTDMSNQQQPFLQAGGWMDGTSRVSVQAENRLGKYDRVTHLDGIAVYYELIDYQGGTLKARYPIVTVNNLETMAKRYGPTDFTLNQDGTLTFVQPLAKGTRISFNYMIHPRWLVVSHPHTIRLQLTSRKRKPATLQTPLGDVEEMAVQGVVQLDHLVVNAQGENA